MLLIHVYITFLEFMLNKTHVKSYSETSSRYHKWNVKYLHK